MESKVKKIISQEYIEELDSKIFSIDTGDALDEMDKFIVSQKALIKFIIEKISDYPQHIQEKSNFINFFIWKAFDENFPEVTIEQLELLYQQNLNWFKKILSVPKKGILEALRKEMTRIRQPNLLNWVLEELLENSKNMEEITFEIQVNLFIIFKTIIDVFDVAVNGQR